MTGPRSGRSFTAAAVLSAVSGVLLVYYGQIDTGLFYDDYHFLRPIHPLELRRVWFGSWDTTGIESPFFRPLTAWLFALRFWAFGLNTQALHAISLVGHASCAVAVGWFLRREGVPTGVSLTGVWLYASHPLFPYAQVSWLTNQMHLVESIAVILALLGWQAVRDRQTRWFAVLLPLAAIAFLIKEDAVMLLPVLVVLTVPRAWLQPSSMRVFPVLLMGLVAVTGLFAFRHQRLGRLGGYGVPGLDQAQLNFWKGLDASLLLWPTRSPWQALAALIAIIAVALALPLLNWKRNRIVTALCCAAILILASKLPALFLQIDYPRVTFQGIGSGVVTGLTLAGGALAAARQTGRPIMVMLTGLVVTAGFNLPFVLVTKREQYHLIALGAVLVLAGAIDAVQASTSKASRFALIIAVLVSVPLALLARGQAAAFGVCAPPVLTADAEAASWWVVPAEIRTWLAEKRRQCEAGLIPSSIVDLPAVTWGVFDEEQGADAQTYRWTSDRVTLLIRLDAASVAFGFKSPGASGSAPTLVRVASGGRAAEVRLDSPEWTYMTVRLRSGILSRLRSAHRVDISVTPWFVPAARDPRQSDLRRLGVQFRIVGN